jgi:homoserine dehydrogenase
MLHEHADDIARRAGVPIEVTGVLVQDPTAPRDVPVPADRFRADGPALIAGPSVAVVVEVMGGIEPARTLILEALRAGTPVVSANKELLATHSQELFEAAEAGGTEILYEAAVGGGIPLIRPLREHLAGDRIIRFMGIVNGTTNYILTRMSEDGLGAPEALVEAQRLGYAEADPTADVDGFDAAAKAAILAGIAFDLPVVADDVHREGIGRITADDIAYGRQLGYVLKLLAIADAVDGGINVRVHPSLIPADHPLASVRESFNAVFIEGERVGPLMLYGRGAGGDPTATSVVGDVIELARGASGKRARPAPLTTLRPYPREGIRPIGELRSQYYLRLEVADRAGVLAAIASVFADHDVSIKSVRQEGHGAEAQLVLVTHEAVERDLAGCVRDLERLDAVESVGAVIRVVAGEP